MYIQTMMLACMAYLLVVVHAQNVTVTPQIHNPAPQYANAYCKKGDPCSNSSGICCSTIYSSDGFKESDPRCCNKGAVCATHSFPTGCCPDNERDYCYPPNSAGGQCYNGTTGSCCGNKAICRDGKCCGSGCCAKYPHGQAGGEYSCQTFHGKDPVCCKEGQWATGATNALCCDANTTPCSGNLFAGCCKADQQCCDGKCCDKNTPCGSSGCGASPLTCSQITLEEDCAHLPSGGAFPSCHYCNSPDHIGQCVNKTEQCCVRMDSNGKRVAAGCPPGLSCCIPKVYQTGPDQHYCYNHTTHFCCNGEILDLTPTSKCCGSTVYNSTTQCCTHYGHHLCNITQGEKCAFDHCVHH